MGARVRLGNERLLDDAAAILGRRRAAVLVHPPSVTPDFVPLVDALIDRGDVDVHAVLAPEHGLFGAAQDMEAVASHAYRGVPVHSLYGASVETLSPPGDLLDDIDAIVVDLQDVGARYYTFVWTAALCLKAAAAHGRSVIVCDRPNPLGGEIVSGPMIDPGYESFVGLYNVPVRHGMTIGEMMRWVATTDRLDVDLRVLPMEGWRRGMGWEQTGLPWIPPSPNMPALATAAVYPGGCLIEGTTLSEGRGTTTPFEQLGAPGVDGAAFARDLNALNLPGCRFRPVVFRPQFQKHAGRDCGGVFVHITDAGRWDAFATYARVIDAMRGRLPDSFGWRADAYEFVTDIPAFDLLTGSAALRGAIESGVGLDGALAAGFPSGDFLESRRRSLLYPS
jgi:uncharacterized protein YbbC (DUF1343 family)